MHASHKKVTTGYGCFYSGKWLASVFIFIYWCRSLTMKTSAMTLRRLALLTALALGSTASHGAPVFDPAQQPYGQVPQLAITGFNLATGTQKAFQGWFDSNSWAGDVVAYPIGTDGRTDATARLWSAAAVYAASQAC
jgi:hypothetical protein